MLFLHADWLVQKWLANIIHLWAAEETNLYVYNVNSDHFLLEQQKKKIVFVSV